MADGTTKTSAIITNPTVSIGDTIQGSATVTSLQPCTITSLRITLSTEGYDDISRQDDDDDDDNQWVFSKETIPVNLQLQANETKTIPFNFFIKDGIDRGMHSIMITARLNDSNFGPFTAVEFVIN